MMTKTRYSFDTLIGPMGQSRELKLSKGTRMLRNNVLKGRERHKLNLSRDDEIQFWRLFFYAVMTGDEASNNACLDFMADHEIKATHYLASARVNFLEWQDETKQEHIKALKRYDLWPE